MSQTFVYKKVDNCSIKGELHPCSEKNAPLVVYIHGGGLIWGTRNDIKKEQIKWYTNAGFHVFSIDYRLAPETKLPKITSDIEDALNWLSKEGWKKIDFDPNRVAVIGSSAGGYLALMTGTFQLKPKAIVSFYGYGDIIDDWYTKPSTYFNSMTTVPEILANQLIQKEAISEAPIERRYAIYLFCRQQGKWLDYVADIAHDSDLAAQLDAHRPIRHIDNDYPTTLLIHGDQDEDVPYNESIKMRDALEQAGVCVELLTIPNGKHSFDDKMDDSIVIKTYENVIAFLKQHV